MGAVLYVDEQRMLRSDCTDAHGDLDLRFPQSITAFFVRKASNMYVVSTHDRLS